MNIYTQWIMEYTGQPAERAMEIQDYIDCNDMLDWSECDTAEFQNCVEDAIQEMV